VLTVTSLVLLGFVVAHRQAVEQISEVFKTSEV
jgi:hypothetical protein